MKRPLKGQFIRGVPRAHYHSYSLNGQIGLGILKSRFRALRKIATLG